MSSAVDIAPPKVPDPAFWCGRRVWITGHRGFIGSWLCVWLLRLGARVSGLDIAPPGRPGLFQHCGLARLLDDRSGDIRHEGTSAACLRADQPEVVFHLAALSTLQACQAAPTLAFDIHVMGCIQLLNAVRACNTVRACVIVSSDKCYQPAPPGHRHQVGDPLGGTEPYSASKAASELAVAALRPTWFADGRCGVATARPGNTIGAGDASPFRLVPRALRALEQGLPVGVYGPGHTRPWQHVLDLVCGLLCLAERLHAQPRDFGRPWNFGPAAEHPESTLELVRRLTEAWGGGSWQRVAPSSAAAENACLQLDSSQTFGALDWRPRCDLDGTLRATVRAHRALGMARTADDALEACNDEIRLWQPLSPAAG